MKKAEVKRRVCRYWGKLIRTSESEVDLLALNEGETEDDDQRFLEAQQELARELLRRGGEKWD